MHHSALTPDPLTYAPRRAAADIDAVIKAHAQLVRRIAWNVHARLSSAIDIEDLIQIGLVALVEAARGFDDRGLAFAPYAATRVRGAMIDELRRDARMARSGMVNRRRLAAARAALERELGRRASDAEMASAMNLAPHAYHTMVASTMAARQEPIDDAYSDHDMGFADLGENAQDKLETADMRALLAECIAELSEREAMVLQLYFVEELTLEEIGAVLKVGAARVCQIKKTALDRLRAMMAETE